ncbi:flavocytochrome c [Spirochaetia bacterium]|nr:flavocytochrome c [Spirochaetia bacterium]
MKKTLGVLGALLLALVIMTGCGSSGKATGPMKAGTYQATVPGMHGPLSVEVTVGANAISAVKVTANVETPGLNEWPVKFIPERIVKEQSLAVDVVTGVSITSRAIINGVEKCLDQAGANVAAFKKAPKKTKAKDESLSADVVIVGGGGAGLSAAVAATEAGANVILIEKTGFLGGNSIVAGGIYNVANTELQNALKGTAGEDKLVADALAETPINEEHRAMQEKVRVEFAAYKQSGKTFYDSPAWHALQTWNGGDKLGYLSIIAKMTSTALPSKEWLESMGMKFLPKVTQGAGSLYPRTLTAELPNGVGYIKAFRDTLEGRSNYTQIMETTAKGLIVEGGRVVGVNAEGRDGHKVTLRAKNGVILVTGGFAGNVKLRQEYCEGEKWPDLGPSLITSNVSGVTGDGIFFARDAGAQLVNMDQIQLLHVCNPITGATGDIAAPSSVAGYLFINKDGKRFVREDGRRDEISIAIIAQPDSMMYMVQSSESMGDPAVAQTLDKRTVAYMLENKISDYIKVDTLEDLAKTLGMPVDNLVKTIADYNAAVDAHKTADEFGRVVLSRKIATGPWYAFPRKPASHHTMGGVLIDEDGHALKADGSKVDGLYCAGEITGVVHGGNRLGGNAIVDFTVFGRIAGASAAAGK